MRHDNRSKSPVRQPRTEENDQSFAFRRSRTITGSATSTLRAAGESRGQLQSSRLHEHSLRKHRKKLVLYLFGALMVSAVLWYIVANFLGSFVTVSTKTAQPLTSPLDTLRYQSLVSAYFNDRPFERFKFALNEENFSTYMSRNASEVRDAELTQGETYGSTSLTLSVREPVVAWTIKDKQYFVDAEGTAYTRNYFTVPGVVVTDKSGISADAGVVASQKLLRFIGRVVSLINDSELNGVETVELPVNSTREIHFKLKEKPYIIKGHLDRDPAGQAADIINAVRYVELKEINPAYLDVRVSSKAFYLPQ